MDELDSFQIEKKNYEFRLLSGKISDEHKSYPLIVAPYNLGFLLNENLPNFTNIATVNISINNANNKEETEDKQGTKENQYLEDEELYSAHDLKTNFQAIEFSICSFKSASSRSFNCVTMPNLSTFHPILYNKLSQYLICECLMPDQLIVLTPCALNYGQCVCKLISSKMGGIYESIDVPFLKPPHFISGITAACFATSSTHSIESLALILDSEGVLNFERIKEDSILLAANILVNQFFNLNADESAKYIKEITKKASVCDYVNSGMYI